MTTQFIPDEIINEVAKEINIRSNKDYGITPQGDPDNPHSPHYFEIVPFTNIDNFSNKIFAIDGSINSQEFYNGVTIGLYTAGFVAFQNGKEIDFNNGQDLLIKGIKYYPQNVLCFGNGDLNLMYNEFLSLPPVKKMIDFLNVIPEEIFAFKKETLFRNFSTFLSFAQEVLEWSIVFDLILSNTTTKGDIILRDGTLRSNNIKQEYLIKLGKLAREKEVVLIAITKATPIKTQLSYTFKRIDNYLQDDYKPKYQFTITVPEHHKLGCWFKVSEDVIKNSYSYEMFGHQGLSGGRGLGVFLAARLDYVEKLQNYDWMIVDMNIFDIMPNIAEGKNTCDISFVQQIMISLSMLTQEHYILGYPYPLVEVHNFVSIKNNFKEEIINRVKSFLYQEQQMDNVDIENLFLDLHQRF